MTDIGIGRDGSLVKFNIRNILDTGRFALTKQSEKSMSYEAKKDEMVGRYVAEFQNELSLAKSLKGFALRPVMPYGYPIRLYHPYHIVKSPRHIPMIHHKHDRLSNNVPWVLGMELVDNNVIGVYNPKR